MNKSGFFRVWTSWRTPERKGRTKYDFNRRIPKTACPVVWEGAGAQSLAPDPIGFKSEDPMSLATFTMYRISRLIEWRPEFAGGTRELLRQHRELAFRGKGRVLAAG